MESNEFLITILTFINVDLQRDNLSRHFIVQDNWQDVLPWITEIVEQSDVTLCCFDWQFATSIISPVEESTKGPTVVERRGTIARNIDVHHGSMFKPVVTMD